MRPQFYFCDRCGRLIWFPFGRKMHIGTGWPCWREHQDEEQEDDPVPTIADFVFDTPPELLRELSNSAVRLYNQWRRHPTDKGVVPFLREQFRDNRTDVVHSFLEYLTTQRDEYPGRLLGTLTTTAEWKRFAARSRQRAAVMKRNRRGKQRPRRG